MLGLCTPNGIKIDLFDTIRFGFFFAYGYIQEYFYF